MKENFPNLVKEIVMQEGNQKSTIWNKRKKETSNRNRMKKQEFKKMKRDLETSSTTLNIPNLNYRGARRRRGRTKN